MNPKEYNLFEKYQKLKRLVDSHKRIIIIGNGGSNAVASHVSVDYTKVLKKECLSFSDSPRLTCYINDYGEKQAYVEFLKDFVNDDTLVILISSSGESMNIVNCAIWCSENNIPTILLSGFKEDNKLNSFKYNNNPLKFWIDSVDYGDVERKHLKFLHSIVEFTDRKLIGFTCGTFDLLHAGHILMLKEIKERCKYLVVGLQRDPSIRVGKNKPIQTEEERALQLSAVEYVDEVIVYDTEEDLVGLLIEIKPDERYVGSDWKDNPNLTGADLDIPIHYNSRDHGYSSTELRERVQTIMKAREHIAGIEFIDMPRS